MCTVKMSFEETSLIFDCDINLLLRIKHYISRTFKHQIHIWRISKAPGHGLSFKSSKTFRDFQVVSNHGRTWMWSTHLPQQLLQQRPLLFQPLLWQHWEEWTFLLLRFAWAVKQNRSKLYKLYICTLQILWGFLFDGNNQRIQAIYYKGCEQKQIVTNRRSTVPT